MSDEARSEFTRSLDQAVADLGIAAEPAAAAGSRRRAAQQRREIVMTIVEQDGVLHLEAEPPVRRLVGGRRRSARALGMRGDVVKPVRLAALERNQIGAALETLDARLTPFRGLRRLRDDGSLAPGAQARRTGRILLLVHGTFSNCDNLVHNLKATPHGEGFVRWALEKYDQVLSFDHATLGLSPMLNAHALHHALSASHAAIDVVCHSRGGLVTRWWLEGFDHTRAEKRRVVFVGCPLNGTGLAAPPNLRGSLSLLASYARALGTASAMLPLTTAVSGVFQIVASIASLTAKTPVIDAAVAMVPGLAAMSRVGNNFELGALRQPPPELKGRYFAVQSNFESQQVGWRFWEAFRGLKSRVADAAADQVFDGPNDLVVDTSSMVNFHDALSLPTGQVHDFGTTDAVHHTNYFEQKRTLDFIQRELG